MPLTACHLNALCVSPGLIHQTFRMLSQSRLLLEAIKQNANRLSVRWRFQGAIKHPLLYHHKCVLCLTASLQFWGFRQQVPSAFDRHHTLRPDLGLEAVNGRPDRVGVNAGRAASPPPMNLDRRHYTKFEGKWPGEIAGMLGCIAQFFVIWTAETQLPP